MAQFSKLKVGELQALKDASTPLNTVKANSGVDRKYKKWRTWKLKTDQEKEVLPLTSFNYTVLSRNIAEFFCEIRRLNGQKYRCDSIRTYFANIARCIVNNNPEMDIHVSPIFAECRKVVDGLMKTMRIAEGPGRRQEESEMKMMRLMGKDRPDTLQNALAYKLTKRFGLQSHEINSMLYANIQSVSFPDTGKVKIIYREDISKTNHGGLKAKSSQGKHDRGGYTEDASDEFSITQLLDLYLRKLPHDADLSRALWFRPLQSYETNGIWYSSEAYKLSNITRKAHGSHGHQGHSRVENVKDISLGKAPGKDEDRVTHTGKAPYGTVDKASDRPVSEDSKGMGKAAASSNSLLTTEVIQTLYRGLRNRIETRNVETLTEVSIPPGAVATISYTYTC